MSKENEGVEGEEITSCDDDDDDDDDADADAAAADNDDDEDELASLIEGRGSRTNF